MKMPRLAKLVGLAGLAFAAQACVVRDAQPVNSGYGYSSTGSSAYASGGIYVGEPSVSYTTSMPPQPLYESMTASPGYQVSEAETRYPNQSVQYRFEH